MKCSQPNITAALGAVLVAGLVAADARAQATQYYPPSPRVRYAWRPVSTPDIVIKPAAIPATYTAAVLPPPSATPITAYQPAAFQSPPLPTQPPVLSQPPALSQPAVPASCCGNTGCLGQTYAPVTYASPYGQATYAPTTSAVKAYRPLVHLVPPPPTYTVGQGLWGQSKVYIPDQHIRNTLRYLTP